MATAGVPRPQCPHIPGACSSAVAESSCLNSALQPKAGQRKGLVAVKKSRSRSAPPAPGLEPRHCSGPALAFPHLHWQVAAMEEMLIWEQHTVTLSKVSVAEVTMGWQCWGQAVSPSLSSLLGPSSGLRVCRFGWPGPSQQGDWGHGGHRLGCGVQGTGVWPASVSAQGPGDTMGGISASRDRKGSKLLLQPEAEPRLPFPHRRRDQIVMVNGLSMENVSSSFAIQTLKTCGKIANIVSVPCRGTALCLSPSCPCVTVPVCRVCSGSGQSPAPVAALRSATSGYPWFVFWAGKSPHPHPFLLSFHLQTLKRQKKIHLPVSKSSPASPAATRRYDSDEDYDPHGVDPALRSASQHRSRDDLDHNQGYDGDSSSERSSGHHRDDRRHHKASRSRRRSQDSSHWRQSPDSGSEHRGYSRHRSTNGFGHAGDTNGLALVSGFKRLPRRDVPMKPITSVLVKKKEDEGGSARSLHPWVLSSRWLRVPGVRLWHASLGQCVLCCGH